jgi:hypothetical protein
MGKIQGISNTSSINSWTIGYKFIIGDYLRREVKIKNKSQGYNAHGNKSREVIALSFNLKDASEELRHELFRLRGRGQR